MVHREYRNREDTPEEADRRARRACLNCGKPREEFDGRHRGGFPRKYSNYEITMASIEKRELPPLPTTEGHFCCSSECTAEYWEKKHPTVAQMRMLVFEEQECKCKRCGKVLDRFDSSWILDHITPIAMGGSQWARKNLQVLCCDCNKEKTAKDMGKIARHKRYNRGTPPPLIDPSLTQKTLF